MGAGNVARANQKLAARQQSVMAGATPLAAGVPKGAEGIGRETSRKVTARADSPKRVNVAAAEPVPVVNTDTLDTLADYVQVCCTPGQGYR